MNVAVRDMMSLSPLWRRSGRKPASRVTSRRRPVAPVTHVWEGVTAALHSTLIMAMGLVLAGILGWGWSMLVNPQVLPIKRVQVEGIFTHVNASMVRSAIASTLQSNFLTVDVRRVQQTVQTLPWVRHAEVRRVWPDTVHIRVIEQVPVAKWGKAALVNGAGEIFKPPFDDHSLELPSLQGPDGSGAVVVTALRDMGEILAPLDLHIKHLSLDERRAWSLDLDNGMRLLLGRGDGYGHLLKFVRFYHRAFHDRTAAVDRVDLRYSNGFAVSWKNFGKQH
jgi:cell division protein FtsQ